MKKGNRDRQSHDLKRRLQVEKLEHRRVLATLFVDGDASGGDGSSWPDAIADLESGLQAARDLNADAETGNDITEIWVAEGVYRPTRIWHGDSPRLSTFELVDGVSLVGGFAGDETSKDQRLRDADGALSHQTILSGDLGDNDDDSLAFSEAQGDRIFENAFTVAWVSGTLPVTIDGLTITGGWSEFTPGTVITTFPDDIDLFGKHLSNGGGLLVTGNATIEITASSITRNFASQGAGVWSEGLTLSITSSDLSSNASPTKNAFSGAAVYASGDVQISQSRLHDNFADNGGAIYALGDLSISASTFKGNGSDGLGGAIYSEGSVTASDSEFANNFAKADSTSGGGAIFSTGSVTINGSTVIGNSTDGSGGAVYADTVRVNGGVWSNNIAVFSGGAICAITAVEVTDASFMLNRADRGGAISTNTYSSSTGLQTYGNVAVFNSVMNDNSSVRGGGAILAGDATVENSQLNFNTAGHGGGAIDVVGDVTITDSTLAGNQSGASGGAIDGGYEKQISVAGSTLRDNLAGAGGGLFGYTVNVSDSIFEGNHAGSGGAIYAKTSLHLTDSTIRDNVAGADGGGILADIVNMAGSNVFGNRAGEDGGGIAHGLPHLGSSTFLVTGSSISDNTAGGDGGGLDGHDMTIIDSLISGNTAGDLGGGLNGNTIVVEGSVVSSNTATSVGGIYSTGLNISDSNVSNNAGGGIYTGNFNVLNTTVDGNRSETSIGGIFGRDGTISDSTITNNRSGTRGGGVQGSTLVIDRSVVTGNHSPNSGGGIHGSDVTLEDSRVQLNTAVGSGGGLWAGQFLAVRSELSWNESGSEGGGFWSGDAILQETKITDNEAQGNAGGIYGDIVLIDSDVSRNRSLSAAGGGIFGDVEATDSVISGNRANGSGGGIAGDVIGTRLDVTANSSGGMGGGVFGSGELTESRVTGNRASTLGGGIYGSVDLVSSTVTENRLADPPEPHDAQGELISEYHDYPRDDRGIVLSREAEDIIYQPGFDYYGRFTLVDGRVGELNARYRDVTIAGLTAVIAPLSIELGTAATFDGSQSVGAMSYAWDLDGDGEFDDGQESTANRTWPQLEQLGFAVGARVVGLKVSADVGNGEVITSTTTARVQVFSTDSTGPQDDLHPEIAARQIAYDRKLKQGEQIGFGNYVVSQVFRRGDFFAVGLVKPSNHATTDFSVGLDPVLAFRGTDNFLVEFATTNANPAGVGFSQFQQNWDDVRVWLEDQKANGETVDFYGHSLGGALVQWFATQWLTEDPENRLGEVITFNSPGIDAAHAQLFSRSSAERVVHNIVDGDVVSIVGEQFISGDVNVYFMNRGSRLDGASVLEKHSCPLQVPEVVGSCAEDSKDNSRPQITVTPGELDLETLNSYWFHYTSTEYYGLLAYLQLGSSLVVSIPRFQPAMLAFRGTAELARKQFGQSLTQILGIDPVDPNLDKLVIDDIKLFGVSIIQDLEFEIGTTEQLPAEGGPAEENSPTPSYITNIKAGATFAFLPGDPRIELEYRDQTLVSFTVIAKPGYPLPILPGFFITEAGLRLENLHVLNAWLSGNETDPSDKLTVTGLGTITFLNEIELKFPGELEQLTGRVDVTAALAKIGGELSLSVNADQDFDFREAQVDAGLIVVELNGSTVFDLAHAVGTLKVDRENQQSVISANVDLLGGVLQGAANLVLDSSSDWKVMRYDDILEVDIARILPFVDFPPSLYQSSLFVTDNPGNKSNEYLRAQAIASGWFQPGFESRFDGVFDSWLGLRESSPATQQRIDRQSQSGVESTRTAVVLKTEQAIGTRRIQIRKPDGMIIGQDEFVNHVDIHLRAALNNEKLRVLEIGQSVTDVQSWEISFVEGDLESELLYYIDDVAPTVLAGPPTQREDGSVDLSFQLIDPDSDATVSFFLDDDQQGRDGYAISRDLTESDSAVHWSPSGLRSGTYYVYSVAFDGVNAPVVTYLDQPVTIATSASLKVTDNSGHPEDRYLRFDARDADSPISETRSFILTNVGTGPADIDEIAIDSFDRDQFDIRIDGVPVDPQTFAKKIINPGDSLQIDLQAFPTSGGAKFVDFALSGNFDSDPINLAATVRARSRAAKVESIRIDDGSGQRSTIRDITVTFDKPVTIDAGAFEVIKAGENQEAIPFSVRKFCDVNGRTIVILDFDDESGLAGSLADGNYQLTIDSQKVIHDGIALEGEDGIGTDYVDQFFRFLGDSDGDRDVDGQDYGRFGLSFLKRVGDSGYDASFDFDGDGDVDGQDYGRFGQNFLRRIAP